MRNKSVIITSIIINSILIVLELFALSEILFRYLPGSVSFKWTYSLTYYTNLSNMLLLIGSIYSLIQDIYELKGIYKIKSALPKFLGVVSTLVTFFTVWILVIISKEIKYGIEIQGSMWLFMHTICPTLGFISFIFFNEKKYIKYTDIIYPAVFTLLYTILVLILFFLNLRIPYKSNLSKDFNITWYFIVCCGLIEIVVSLLIGLIIRFIKNLFRNE